MDIVEGWLEGVRRVPSPNQDARPDASDVTLVVIHGISLPAGEFGGPWVEQLFCNMLLADDQPGFREIEGLRVSAHCFIRRDGSVVQFVPFDRRAWHAGRSSWGGREACNDFSIGIELEGCDAIRYSEAQYGALARLLMVLRQAYPTLSSVVGHSDIAPGRKSDPGPMFDWARVRRC